MKLRHYFFLGLLVMGVGIIGSLVQDKPWSFWAVLLLFGAFFMGYGVHGLQ